MAVVIPKSGLVMTNLEEIIRKVPADKIDMALFATLPEAERWISSRSTKTPPVLEARRDSVDDVKAL